MEFYNSYISLGNNFYQKIKPKKVSNPRLFLWESNLATKLMISDKLQKNLYKLAQIFSGNCILPSSDPIATVYAGHQFGRFVNQLGDGRAHLLGNVIDTDGKSWDIQLKGSGPTAFSRNGDGCCTLGAALREFIMSEAMNALGVPTARCLAVVTTGENIIRDSILPGAVATRVASTHIRIGTFEFFAAKKDYQSLKNLCEYILRYHYPSLKRDYTNPYIKLIDKIIEKQIKMVTEWMRVGFIHGVMNTDNMSICGETIDYGPCAMMNTYDPNTVYSSIDIHGRYAFGKQPSILEWNITRFVECLLPLINGNINKAIEEVKPIIKGFKERFKKEYMMMMGRKIGIIYFNNNKEDEQLIFSLLKQINKKKDYTNIFNLLTESLTSKDIAFKAREDLGEWFDHWQKKLKYQNNNPYKTQKIMRKFNPLVIPRNHHVEEIIKDCEQNKKSILANKFLKVISNPYKEMPDTKKYQDPPKDGDKFYKTFCGT